MEQLRLPMLTVYTGPRLVDLEIVDACRSYRDAVRGCWDLRTRTGLKQRTLAEECDLYPPHVSDYLSLRHAKRDLPPGRINDFELSCGNRLVSQWLARRANLTIMEQYMQQPRRAVA